MNLRAQSGRLSAFGFIAGTGISLVGNSMAMVAIPWFVLQTTGSASQTGFTGFAAALPMAISGVFGGPLVDRLGGRRMSIISDLVSAAAIVAIPILHALDLLTYPLILLLVFLGAALDIPGVTARRMLLPGFQKSAGMRPEQMNSAFEVLSNGSIMIGPALAGIVIGWLGAVSVLWITTMGFLISAAGVAIFAPKEQVDQTDAPKQGYVESLREGFGFIRRTPMLLAMASMFAVTNFISGGFFGVGMVVFVNDVWESAGRLGLLLSCLGVGQIIGATLYGSFGHRLRPYRRWILVGGFMSQALWYAPFIWSESLPLLIAAMFMSGFTAGPINPLSVTVRFEHIPQALRGRVFATFSSITAVISPVGIALMGLVIERDGVQRGMIWAVVLSAIVAVVLPFVTVFRPMNEPGPYAES